ncbi:alpha/beta fold hydrolase [Halomarina salina]|uniref:Alpha/beta fold hydrolase n=1 Tax=Halomarina salina TaxID=1872699 RepID=A0ABD5RHN6_9EURY|nr:alpha/beta hydrolase [Halomarina salina]
MRTHTIEGGDGVGLHVAEAGPTDAPPVLLLHGYSQSHRSWSEQFDSSLADEFRLVGMDSRGHGESEKPHEAYDETESWADDVRAVVESLGLDDVVIVGWSYAGLVTLDYLSVYGTDRVAGVNLVGAVSAIGTEAATALLGETYVGLMGGMTSTDAEESVEALGSFVRLCRHDEIPVDEFYRTLGFTVATPPRVRDALRARTLDHRDVLSSLDVPVLLTHGVEDRVVDVDIVDQHAELVEDVRVSRYPQTGHSPFVESPERFDEELREFVHACRR